MFVRTGSTTERYAIKIVVNCTACIWWVRHNYEKVDLPKGFNSYASEDEIVKKKKNRLFNLGLKGYTAVLVILTGVLIRMFILRKRFRWNLLKITRAIIWTQKGEIISNVVHLLN